MLAQDKEPNPDGNVIGVHSSPLPAQSALWKLTPGWSMTERERGLGETEPTADTDEVKQPWDPKKKRKTSQDWALCRQKLVEGHVEILPTR